MRYSYKITLKHAQSAFFGYINDTAINYDCNFTGADTLFICGKGSAYCLNASKMKLAHTHYFALSDT